MFKTKITQMILISLLTLASTDNFAESLSELQEKAPVTVSFFMDVDPGLTTTFSQTAQIGTQQVLLSDINTELYVGKTLIVKSISIQNISLPTPNPDSYSVVAFGQCGTNSSTFSGFGNSAIATYGPQSYSMDYNPGLVVKLTNKRFELCVKSYIQSSEEARVFVHGVFLDKF